MLLIIAVLLLALILFGVGFAVHVLWWIALIVLAPVAARIPVPDGRKGRVTAPLVQVVAAHP